MKNLIVETFPVGPLQCNCTILGDPVSKEAIVIDPGDEPEKILARLDALGLEAKHLLHTHAHLDHMGGTTDVKRKTGGRILLHEGDKWLYENYPMQSEMFFGVKKPEAAPPDDFITEGDSLRIGSHEVKVIHTPGHTPGSLCFHLGDVDGGPTLFTGDTLFQRGIGRTDLWGGSMEQILESIRTKLYELEPETKVVPGHGPATTIREERVENPFVHG